MSGLEKICTFKFINLFCAQKVQLKWRRLKIFLTALELEAIELVEQLVRQKMAKKLIYIPTLAIKTPNQSYCLRLKIKSKIAICKRGR